MTRAGGVVACVASAWAMLLLQTTHGQRVTTACGACTPPTSGPCFHWSGICFPYVNGSHHCDRGLRECTGHEKRNISFTACRSCNDGAGPCRNETSGTCSLYYRGTSRCSKGLSICPTEDVRIPNQYNLLYDEQTVSSDVLQTYVQLEPTSANVISTFTFLEPEVCLEQCTTLGPYCEAVVMSNQRSCTLLRTYNATRTIVSAIPVYSLFKRPPPVTSHSPTSASTFGGPCPDLSEDVLGCDALTANLGCTLVADSCPAHCHACNGASSIAIRTLFPTPSPSISIVASISPTVVDIVTSAPTIVSDATYTTAPTLSSPTIASVVSAPPTIAVPSDVIPTTNSDSTSSTTEFITQPTTRVPTTAPLTSSPSLAYGFTSAHTTTAMSSSAHPPTVCPNIATDPVHCSIGVALLSCAIPAVSDVCRAHCHPCNADATHRPTTQQPAIVSTLATSVPSANTPSITVPSTVRHAPTFVPSRAPTMQFVTIAVSTGASDEEQPQTLTEPSVTTSTTTSATSNPPAALTMEPSERPTLHPSTANPTAVPTIEPSARPTLHPSTANPTAVPTIEPSARPTLHPSTANPTAEPTIEPLSTDSPTIPPTLSVMIVRDDTLEVATSGGSGDSSETSTGASLLLLSIIVGAALCAVVVAAVAFKKWRSQPLKVTENEKLPSADPVFGVDKGGRVWKSNTAQYLYVGETASPEYLQCGDNDTPFSPVLSPDYLNVHSPHSNFSSPEYMMANDKEVRLQSRSASYLNLNLTSPLDENPYMRVMHEVADRELAWEVAENGTLELRV